MADCTSKCNSTQHAEYVFSAITKGKDCEDKVLKFLQSACHNTAFNKDIDGQSAIHVAASLGRLKILEWLLSKNIPVDIKDRESGYSPLHRAIYFGQLGAVRYLVCHQSNIFQLDNDDLTCIDHLIKDRIPSPTIMMNPDPFCEVHVWGSNSNYTLGQRNQQGSSLPEVMEVFKKESNNIKQVLINKFHSIFVDKLGKVFSCGHGPGGRLGQDSEHSVLTPRKIAAFKEEVCLQASISTDHTIFLMETGSVWSCGLNQFHQLGHNPPPVNLLAPKCIHFFSGKNKSVLIKGICSGRFHSVFWSSSDVYTCGLNAGQLGHLKGDKTVIVPKQVSSLTGQEGVQITLVAASDGATAVATNCGDVYLLHEYQCRRIASKQLDVIKIVMIGGNLDSTVQPDVLSVQGGNKLLVLMLTTSGKIFVWSQLNPVLTRCFFSSSHQFFVRDVALNHSSILLISREGEAFSGKLATTGSINNRKKSKTAPEQKKTAWLDFYLREQSYSHVKVKRIPGIYRAVGIACDPEAKNFAALQVQPSAHMTELPEIPPSELNQDLKLCLDEADIEDPIHDIVFVVAQRRIAAHRLFLAAFADSFYRNFCVSNDNAIHITDIPFAVFRLILEFIYTGTCSLLQPGPCGTRFSQLIDLNANDKNISKKSEKKNIYQDIIKSVQKCCMTLKLKSLHALLEKVRIKNDTLLIQHDVDPRPILNRTSMEHLSDVVISSEDGKKYRAHRAILASRLDYFRSMFACGWMETFTDKTITLPVRSSILEVVLDFVYEDRASRVERSEDLEFVCNCLAVADQLLIPRLVAICESSAVRLLSLKNAGELLEFSCVYNATQLKTSCMEFICSNLVAVVELRSWDCVSDGVMQELTTYYQQKFHPAMAYRCITPSSIAPSTEELDSYEVIVDNVINDAKRNSTKQRSNKVGRKSVETKERQLSTCSSDSVQEISTSIVTLSIQKPKFENWSTVGKTGKRNNKPSVEQGNKPESSPPIAPISPLNLSKMNLNPLETSPVKSLVKEDPVNLKQHQPILYELATVIQSTPVLPSMSRSKKFPKMTQKQRKGLSSNVEANKPEQQAIEIVVPETPPKLSNAWKIPESQPPIATDFTNVEPNDTHAPLRNIIDRERRENRNLVTVRSKPLKITLIEEGAIEELQIFYQVDNVFDEFISVERVSAGCLATPIWHSPKK